MTPLPHSIITPDECPIEFSGAPIEPIAREPVEIEHKALVGDSLSNRAAERQPTISTLGKTPFENDGEEVAHYKIVATEIVSDPIQLHVPEPLLKNAIVLLEPRLSECQELVQAANKRGLFVTVVNTIVNNGVNIVSFIPPQRLSLRSAFIKYKKLLLLQPSMSVSVLTTLRSLNLSRIFAS